MKKFGVTKYEGELHKYYYEVEANSPEEAKTIVNSGEVKYEYGKFVSGETISTEIKEIK